MKRIAKRVAAGTALLSLVVAGGAWGWSWWDEGRSREWTDNAYVRADITAISPKVSGYVGPRCWSTTIRWSRPGPCCCGSPMRIIGRSATAPLLPSPRPRPPPRIRPAARTCSGQIRETEAAVDVGRADVELSRRELARATRLVDQGWTPQRNLRHGHRQLRSRPRALAQAEAVAAAAREQLAVLDSETRQIDARLAEARANLQLAEIALADTVIRAPVAGVVGNRRVHAGEYVRPCAALLSVVPVDAAVGLATSRSWFRTRRRSTRGDLRHRRRPTPLCPPSPSCRPLVPRLIPSPPPPDMAAMQR